MMIRHSDCSCEDFPCCGHYDTIQEGAPFCDRCGFDHSPFHDCFEEDVLEDDEDDEDAQVLRAWLFSERASARNTIAAHMAARAEYDTPFDERDYEDLHDYE